MQLLLPAELPGLGIFRKKSFTTAQKSKKHRLPAWHGLPEVPSEKFRGISGYILVTSRVTAELGTHLEIFSRLCLSSASRFPESGRSRLSDSFGHPGAGIENIKGERYLQEIAVAHIVGRQRSGL